MQKIKKTRRKHSNTKLVKEVKSCKNGVTDEVMRIRRLIQEVKVHNKKTAKLKQKMNMGKATAQGKATALGKARAQGKARALGKATALGKAEY